MLNIKKTLTKLLGRMGMEEFNLTVSYSSFDMAYGYGRYDRAANSVRLYFVAYDSANLPQNTALFTVPEKYRPSQTYAVPIVYGASSSVGTYYASLSTDGTIKQNAGSTLRSIFGFVEYKLGGVIRTLKKAISNLYREEVAVC